MLAETNRKELKGCGTELTSVNEPTEIVEQHAPPKDSQLVRELEAGGKPSTWFPPGRLVEHIYKIEKLTQAAKQTRMKMRHTHIHIHTFKNTNT